MIWKLSKSTLEKTLMLTVMAWAALTAGSLTAADQTDGSRPEVGQRALPQAEFSAKLNQRDTLEEQELEQSEESNSKEDNTNHLTIVINNHAGQTAEDIEHGTAPSTAAQPGQTENKELQARAAVYYTTHSGVYRTPAVVSYNGSTVELDDGSVWTVAVADREFVLNWWTSDTILVMPNNSGFNYYRYKIVNQNTGAYARVNLQKAPFYNGAATHFITAIDYFAGKVWLNDGTVWSTDYSDSTFTDRWMVNDTVIMGINNGSLISLYPNILINVSTLEYSRCECLY